MITSRLRNEFLFLRHNLNAYRYLVFRNMLRRSVFLSALFLYCYLITVTPTLNTCWRENNISPSIDDCQAALSMIPNGRLEFTGTIGIPLNFNLPAHARKPFSRVFRAGTCTIIAYRPRFNPNQQVYLPPPQPKYAATAMYFIVWPGIRKAAEGVLKNCLLTEKRGFNGGVAKVDIEVEGVTRKYGVILHTRLAAVGEAGS